MALSKDDILEAIASMSVMEVVELVAAMEEKFGVSAQAAVAVAASSSVASHSSQVAGHTSLIIKNSPLFFL